MGRREVPFDVLDTVATLVMHANADMWGYGVCLLMLATRCVDYKRAELLRLAGLDEQELARELEGKIRR